MLTRKRSIISRWLTLWVVIGLIAGQCPAAASGPELPDPGNPKLTRDQQQKLGLQVAGEVYKRMPVLPDSSPETKYIQRLGKRLVATIPPEHSWPFQFHVVAQKEINAFALPGGPMFVNIGTIQAADNEAELAGVMAHEMAHVYMQHSAKQQEKGSLLGGLAGLAGAIAGGIGGVWGNMAQMGIQLGAGTVMLKYSRSDEAQADAVGAIILWKAGYNPVALADFFLKLEAKGGTGPQFLSDHPNPGNRKTAIQNEIRGWPPRKFSGDNTELASVKKHAEGVRSYSAQEIADGAKNGLWASENQKNGAVLPGAAANAPTPAAAGTLPSVSVTDVQPSPVFKNTDLRALRMDRPENWDVASDAQTSSVTIAPRAGLAGDAVAYGVVVRAVRAPGSSMSVDQLTSAIVQNLASGDSNMKQIGDVQTVTVGGAPAGSADLETVSPLADSAGKPQRERDWLVAVPREGSAAIYFVFVAPQAHFDQMRPTFERMLHSVQF